jgi:hypothetical protein
MNISEILTKNRIKFVILDGRIHIQCPSCQKVDSNGTPQATFYIDTFTERGSCGESGCGIVLDREGLLDALNIKNDSNISRVKDIKGEKEEFASVQFVDDKTKDLITQIISNIDMDTETPSFEFKRIGEIIRTDYGPVKWIVEKLVPAEAFTIISADPGNFKTWLTMEIALSVSKGSEFVGYFPTSQCPILMIDEEDSERIIQDRFKCLGIEKPDELPIHYLCKAGFNIMNKNGLASIMNHIIEHGIKLVIFDSLIRIHGGDENTSRDMAAVYRRFNAIMKLGVSVIATHHHRKNSEKTDSPQSLRGSSDIGAGLDSHLIVFKEEEEGMLYLSQPKLRLSEPNKPFAVKIIKKDNGGIGFEYAGEDDRSKKKSEIIEGQILKLLNDSPTELTFVDIKEKLPEGTSVNAIRTALKMLCAESSIVCERRASGKHFYSLSETPKEGVKENVKDT